MNVSKWSTPNDDLAHQEKVQDDGSPRVIHRDNEYNSDGFEILKQMQDRHFWYRGRHRFLLRSVHDHVREHLEESATNRVIDLGGGCGGWLAYFANHSNLAVSELALGDSSETALTFAAECLPPQVSQHHVDLMELPWMKRWEVAFLLDVLEHIPQHQRALQQIHSALTPGGLLFITVPALDFFWTWNDELTGHQRRYAKSDFASLAEQCGYKLLDCRYFMFFLSPLLLVSRLAKRRQLQSMSRQQIWQLSKEMHQVPNTLVNSALSAVFCSETPLGHFLPFPWGTSLLAVLQKPR
jgi:SAM-dependent methyltransferase